MLVRICLYLENSIGYWEIEEDIVVYNLIEIGIYIDL